MSTLVIIPAYNEEESIIATVEELREQTPQYDYVIINDGSRDRTSELCRARGYDIIDLPANLGLTGAFQTGMKYAHRHGYDHAIQFDADGQHIPVYIENLVRDMEQTAPTSLSAHDSSHRTSPPRSGCWDRTLFLRSYALPPESSSRTPLRACVSTTAR